MKYDKNKPLNDIEYRIQKIKLKLKGVSYLEFENNEDLQDIIRISLIEIGEASNNLILKFKENKKIFRKMRSFRNLIIHSYWINRKLELWEVSKNELIELEKVIFEIQK